MAAIDEHEVGDDTKQLELSGSQVGAVAENDARHLLLALHLLVLVDAVRRNVEDAIRVTVQARQHGGPRRVSFDELGGFESVLAQGRGDNPGLGGRARQLFEHGGAFKGRIADDQRCICQRALHPAPRDRRHELPHHAGFHRQRPGPRVPAIVEHFPGEHRARVIHQQDEGAAIGRVLFQRPGHQKLEERRAQGEIGRGRSAGTIE